MTIEAAPPVPSLNDQIDGFGGRDAFDWIPPSIAAPDVDGAMLRRLGSPPGNLKQPLETLYQAMTVHVQTKIIDNDRVQQS